MVETQEKGQEFFNFAQCLEQKKHKETSMPTTCELSAVGVCSVTQMNDLRPDFHTSEQLQEIGDVVVSERMQTFL